MCTSNSIAMLPTCLVRTRFVTQTLWRSLGKPKHHPSLRPIRCRAYWRHRLTLKPILLLRQLLKSDIISDTGTLSWGRLGPEQHGTTEDRSNSTTCNSTFLLYVFYTVQYL